MWPKLDSLERMQAIDPKSFVMLPFFHFDVATWRAQRDAIINCAQKLEIGPTVIVRSCAKCEDQEALEPPGFFESVMCVPLDDRSRLECAIDKVIQSYSRRLGAPADQLEHKVIVQQELVAPELCGVCHVGSFDSDYIYVDFNDDSGHTNAVTAGLRTKRVSLAPCLDKLSERWRSISNAARQVASHFERPLFIEFAVSRDGQAAIFQVRRDRRKTKSRLAEKPPASAFSCRLLTRAASRLAKLGPLSVMADWNPAEMLGFNPKPLDISLYQRLLTNGAWAEGRAAAGWQKPKDSSLMVVFGGRPYIKLATSIESLLPSGLTPDLTDRLVADRLDFLHDNPELHDKIEFRVMWSARAFDGKRVSADLVERGFSKVDVEMLLESLGSVTRNAFVQLDGWRAQDLRELEKLNAQRDVLAATNWDKIDPPSAAKILRAALRVCRRCGTQPFARQARLAFMLRYIVNYFVRESAALADQVDTWFRGINTVTRRLSDDIGRLTVGKMSRAEFDGRYGHLRPGAYDLESARYDEIVDFPAGAIPADDRVEYGVAAKPLGDCTLAALLQDIAPSYEEHRFWHTCGETFRAREEIKFRFTALLSDVLRALSRLGAISQLENSMLRQLTIEEILSVFTRSAKWFDVHKLVMPTLNRKAIESQESAALVLPELVFDTLDLFVVPTIDARPTFIGSARVEAPLKMLRSGWDEHSDQLAGRIVAIRSPDPGYDWIFGQGIAGLLTEYGGEFSHMALRCAEFGIPAAIGCGQQILEKASSAERVTLHCKAQEIWADGRRICSQ